MKPIELHGRSSMHRLHSVVVIGVVIGVLATSALVPASSGSPSREALVPAMTPASLKTFAGSWIGHTRSLTISRTGKAVESIGDGCCDPIIDLTFQLSNLHGTAVNARATATVLAVHVRDKTAFTKSDPPPHVGEVKQIRLVRGVISETLIGTNYCGPTASPPGICGA